LCISRIEPIGLVRVQPLLRTFRAQLNLQITITKTYRMFSHIFNDRHQFPLGTLNFLFLSQSGLHTFYMLHHTFLTLITHSRKLTMPCHCPTTTLATKHRSRVCKIIYLQPFTVPFPRRIEAKESTGKLSTSQCVWLGGI